MRLLLIGYMFLFIHRPFEIWPTLGTLRLELIYMLGVCLVWLFCAQKKWLSNPLHVCFGFFVFSVLICWVSSRWVDEGAFHVEKYLKLVVFYVLLVTSVNEEVDLKRIIDCLLIIMT